MHGSKGPTPLEYATRRDAERRTDRRVLGPALAASAVLHLAVLLLFTFSIDPDPRARGAAPQRIIDIEPAMQAYDVAVVGAEAAPLEVQLEERRRAVEAAPVQRPWTAPAVSPGEPAAAPDPAMSTRDRLQYRMGSSEVWRPQAPPPVEELSPDEIVRRRVAAQLGEYNDSISAEAAAAARATDWTVKDGSGGRWGVSPGKVHLGDVTLPLPFALSAPGRREEIAGRVRSWTEIQDQAARVEGREIFDDRVRAIRERAEQERARRNATTENNGGGEGSGGG